MPCLTGNSYCCWQRRRSWNKRLSENDYLRMNRKLHPTTKRHCLGMKIRIIALLCVFFIHTASAQQASDFVLSKTIAGDLADFTVDKLGNIYVLSQDNQVKKLSTNGGSLAEFHDVRPYVQIWSNDLIN